MEPNHLRGDELVHEIQSRGLVSARAVEENREILRDFFRRERMGEVFGSTTFAPLREFGVCPAKLAKFELVDKLDEKGCKRLISRLTHVLLRLGRVLSSEPDEQDEKCRLKGVCLEMIGRVWEVLTQKVVARERVDEGPSLIDLDDVSLSSPTRMQDKTVRGAAPEEGQGGSDGGGELYSLHFDTLNLEGPRVPRGHSLPRVGASQSRQRQLSLQDASASW